MLQCNHKAQAKVCINTTGVELLFSKCIASCGFVGLFAHAYCTFRQQTNNFTFDVFYQV